MAEKILMLALSPTMETGIIANWNKKEGDKIESGEVLCEVETDKAVMDYESPASGILLKIFKEQGLEASIGEMIAVIGNENEDISDILNEENSAAVPVKKAVKTEPEVIPESLTEFQSTSYIKSSPLARKLAEINNIDISKVSGSGPVGRIVKRDIEKALAKKSDYLTSAKSEDSLKYEINKSSDEIIPVSGKRKVIAQRLSQSKSSAPHFYLKVTACADKVIEGRKVLIESSGNKVSMNAFLIKIAAEGLKRHPVVNSTWAGDTIIRHQQIDIGLAVAQEDGLITPVVIDCANKGILQIDSELKLLIKKAQENTLKPDEYTGATFTISNLGSFGIDEFTAIINPPGSAILAVGKINREQVVEGGDKISIRSNLKLTLSCDHRVIDGSVGAAFLVNLKNIMENPITVLF